MHWKKETQSDGTIKVFYYRPGQAEPFKIGWEIGDNEAARTMVKGIPNLDAFGNPSDEDFLNKMYTIIRQLNLSVPDVAAASGNALSIIQGLSGEQIDGIAVNDILSYRLSDGVTPSTQIFEWAANNLNSHQRKYQPQGM
jgi:hypothetical protein